MTVLPRIAAVALLASALLFSSCRRAAERPALPSSFSGAPVILISIDTLRADHLPAWGYRGVTTPNIDRLRRDGVMFRNTYAQVPLTLPSHVSMLTGLLPAEHGVRDNVGYRLSTPAEASLPRSLKRLGYGTGAAVSSYVLRSSTGMGSLFDWYDDSVDFAAGADLGAIQRPGQATVAAAQNWIAQQGARPFFLMLHLFEPHSPYDAPEPFRSAASSPYDAEIAQADAIVGAFLDDLQRRGIYERAVIILTSDHGEGLDDHGEAEHGIFVYREAIHVPLIIKLPANTRGGESVDVPAALVDIHPTVLSLVGATHAPGGAGVPLLGPGADVPARKIFSESLYGRLHFGWSDLRSLVDGSHHYIDAPRAELYALAEDPAERRNVLSEERRVAAAFRTEIEKFPRKLDAPSAASQEDAAKLTALGYISAPATSSEGDLVDPKDGMPQYRTYLSARQALARGEPDVAIAALMEVTSANPRFTDAALALAGAYESRGRYAEAVDVYKTLLTRNPALVEQVAIGVATALMNDGRLAEAREHARLAATRNPGAASLLLGRIAMASRAPQEAARHAREAARDAHYEAQAVLLLSEALLAAGPGNEPEAIRALDDLRGRRAAAGQAPVQGLEVARAGVLVRLSRVDEATEALATEIRLFPGSREAYARLAAIKLLQKDLPAAEAVLGEMTRAIPTRASYALAADTLAHFGQAAAADAWRRRGAQAPIR